MRFLCNNIHDVEWSGVLFYKVEGEFGAEDFKATAEHIYPMNKGTQAYTEFETDSSVTEFIMDNLEYAAMQRGLIHSHNNMSVFFSGTDLSEIRDNSEFYNYYLSLIVNNKGDMCAKIAFRGKNTESINKEITFKSNNGQPKTLKLVENKEEDVVFTYDCDIQVDGDKLVDDSFEKRVSEIIQKANVKEVSKSFDSYKSYESRQFDLFEDHIRKNEVEDKGSDIVTQGFLSTLINLDPMSVKKVEDSLKSLKKKWGGSKNEKNEGVVNTYLSTLMENFEVMYHSYFDDIAQDGLESTLEECIDILNEHSTTNWVADEIQTTLVLMLDAFEEKLTNKEKEQESWLTL